MKFYDVLRSETSDEKHSLYELPIIQSALSGKVTKQEYIAFLIQAYHHVKHTVPLLMACGSRFPDHKEWLREAMAEYIWEELGHQEWILNDIRACGVDSEQVRNGSPDISTELMVSYAYDTVMRGNPAGFLGMVYVLEHTSVDLAPVAANVIRRSLGLPENAFSYLYSHGSLEVDHLAFYEKLVNRIDDDNDRKAVVHAARVIYRLYGDVFRSISIKTAQKLAA
jgi:pyrroloquinoline quinone (PQQ) biosynthesis protein C